MPMTATVDSMLQEKASLLELDLFASDLPQREDYPIRLTCNAQWYLKIW